MISEPNHTPSLVPVLSVGMPVYNGARTLEKAVRSVLAQTLAEIEIVISDNGSTDDTHEICKRMAAEDPRVRFVRQPVTLSITDNFKFVLKEARAPFFMWAAHDDVREPDTAEKFISSLEQNQKAILAFGDLIEVTDGVPAPRTFNFVNTDLSRSARLYKSAMGQLYHIYGIWRTDAVRKIHWQNVSWWVDTPFMMAASQLGDFIHVPGPRFIYQFNARPFFGWRKKNEKPSIVNDMRQFAQSVGQLLLMCWLCFVSVNAVAGPWRGLQAMLFGVMKIASQIFGFVWRRIVPVR
ncbi:MAG: glycosyltransferase family 2 protein [Beijerinckiaceae bacterium]